MDTMFASGIQAAARSANRSPMQFEPEGHHLHQHHEPPHQLHLHDDRDNGGSLSTHTSQISHSSHSTNGLPGLSMPLLGNGPVFSPDMGGYSSSYSDRRAEIAAVNHGVHQHRQQQTHQRKQLLQQRQTQEIRGHTRTPVSSNTAELFESLSSAAMKPDSSVHQTLHHGQSITPSGEESSVINMWRQKLFDLEDTVLLTNEQYDTYFPWIDNIYSHRSTQNYKSKPFVAWYYDCRLKGRPSGTKKSDDPNKKKRKRNARGLDLCDVKIKITRYKPGAAVEMQAANLDNPELERALARVRSQNQVFYTFQRINGSVTNGGGDGKPATHKHDLARSDEIKKSTRHRELAELERERKRAKREQDMKRPPKPPPLPWKATGIAADTAKRHSKEGAIKFYASCFCPFSQRVWIALEAKGTDYQYCEIYPLQKPKPTQLLEANPRGLVPAIQQGGWACAESTVVLEYLEDLDRGNLLLLPTDPRLKATCRQWIEFINTRIVPSFYLVLSATEEEAKRRAAENFERDIAELVQAAEEDGPYFLGDHFSLVDIHLAPFAIRSSYLLRQQPDRTPPSTEPRWKKWLDALVQNEFVRNTTSKPDLYEKSMRDLVRAFQARFQGDM